jgi:hypothetical protein
MSGHAAYALVLSEDRGQFAEQKLYPSGEHLPPSQRKPPLSLDCYLSWMSPIEVPKKPPRRAAICVLFPYQALSSALWSDRWENGPLRSRHLLVIRNWPRANRQLSFGTRNSRVQSCGLQQEWLTAGLRNKGWLFGQHQRPVIFLERQMPAREHRRALKEIGE